LRFVSRLCLPIDYGRVWRPGRVLVHLRISPLVAGTSVPSFTYGCDRFVAHRLAWLWQIDRLYGRCALASVCFPVLFFFSFLLSFPGAFLVDGAAPTDSHFVMIWIFFVSKTSCMLFQVRYTFCLQRTAFSISGAPSAQHV